ncbi:YciI family protein [Naasia sp. SYSU D00057]|uniref:YciI family protein n=1 Tax=Naasia sp. SYSU D00057 TaxID=2817380 RepID=UPI001B30BEB7|nr:YciI family protein [Naasia sp. SYSU D00057]
MKYMLVMCDAETDVELSPEELQTMFAVMGAYNDELAEAGVLVTAEGLSPAVEGVRIEYSENGAEVTDGPFAEAKEVFAGYWILETATQEEAVEWARKAPLRSGSITVRRMPSLDEFDLDLDAVKQEGEWRSASGERIG